MGLNETYDSIRSQKLVLEPMPPVSKAYSMVLRVEKQRAVQMDVGASNESSVLLTKSTQQGFTKGNFKKNQRKEDKTCDHCKGVGHTRENCFKIGGYPDWYKQLKKDRGNGSGKQSANMVNNPIEEEGQHKKKEGGSKWITDMSEFIQQEVSRILKNKGENGEDQVNFIQTEEFASNVFLNSVFKNSDATKNWILDIGATSHICNTKDNFHTLKHLLEPIVIHLPDGSKRLVKQHGNIRIHPAIELKNALFISEFKYNLLFVSQLSKRNHLKFIFNHDSFSLQDQKTSGTLVMGRLEGQLYIWHMKSLKQSHVNNCLEESVFVVNSQHEKNLVWHNRLGHPSKDVMRHLPFYKNKMISHLRCEVCQY